MTVVHVFLCCFFFLMIRRPPRSTLDRSSAASDVYKRQQSAEAKKIFEQADEILGFALSEVMFRGSSEELKQTRITQPALFVHAMAKWNSTEHVAPDAVAGHSLGEFSACLLYTSDAADERSSVDLGGRRIIKKKK